MHFQQVNCGLRAVDLHASVPAVKFAKLLFLVGWSGHSKQSGCRHPAIRVVPLEDQG